MTFPRFGRWLGLVLGGLLMGLPASAREVVSLDGVWSFATDPDDRGEAERWFLPEAKLPAMPLPGYAPEANGQIRVPGLWDNQGYGTETEKTRHNFVGKGWYQRRLDIPQAWQGRHVFLTITGASRRAKVWVGEHCVGEHIGYVAPAEFEITPYVQAGQSATITIQVDSKQHWETDALYGAGALADYMDIAYGGIWGHVLLDARADAWLRDLHVQPDVPNSAVSVSATLEGDAPRADRATLEVFDAQGRAVAQTATPLSPSAAGSITLQAPLANPALWSPESPTLYRARLTLRRGDEVLDSQESRLGMRQFTIDGYRLLLNGKPIFLRGYGDDHIYPNEMGMPSDKELHRQRLQIIKSYGFNHVRHHSTMMPPEYYDACDELGIITTAEFPICYTQFLPGTGVEWKKHVAEGTSPELAEETYLREWAGGIRQHRNHPSILCWVAGNEIYEPIPLQPKFAKIAQELDPGRLFVDSDGVWPPIFDSAKDRATVPLYFLQFLEWDNPINAVAKYATVEPRKPIVVHEMGNYVAFTRPDQIELFRGTIKPFWMTAGKENLERLGLLGEAELWAQKSERLYALCHKHNVEAVRHNRYISGYHWWLFQDYWTTGNGLVDYLFRPKSITPEEILRTNNAVVLLETGLERTYRSQPGQRLSVKLSISNFAQETLSGRLVYEVCCGDRVLMNEEVPLASLPQGDLSDVATIEAALPDTQVPAPITIQAEVLAGQQRYRNDWSSWLYPSTIRPTTDCPVFADTDAAVYGPGWSMKPVPEEGTLDARAVYVVTSLEPPLLDALNRGASVLLLGGGSEISTTRTTTYRPSWWKAGDSLDTNLCGTLVYDHPATRAMAPEGWCDAGWFSLIEAGEKCVLEQFPSRPEVLIRALPSLVAVEDAALLYEVGVGRGLLVVSGLNHMAAKDRPEGQWLLARLIDHAGSFPAPKVQWPAAAISVRRGAPEGCLLGFRRLVSCNGEQSRYASFREDRVPTYVSRQTGGPQRVVWQTAPVPRDVQGERVTFAFAGGLGFAAQPKTEGLVLEVNGQDVLRFDLPEPSRWTSEDQRFELRFEKRRAVNTDQLGVFYLTVPREVLTPGKSLELGVHSLGSGSRRWFGLQPYKDLKN